MEQCRSTPTRTGKDQVEKYIHFTFNGSCISECPPQYRKNHDNTSCISCSETICRKECVSPKPDGTLDTFRITTVSEAKHLQSCTHIRGSLAIVGITGNYNSGIESALEKTLGMIEEIDGQLKIIHSHALVSLNFLRNLRVIRGEHINSSQQSGSPDEQAQHTLVVKDNKNLQQLWDWEKKPNSTFFRIKSGKIFFHFNPKLCSSEIEKLVLVAKLPSYSNLEVSRESNGYQTTCNQIPLNVSVEKKASNSVILALHVGTNSTSEINMGRFMVFYKESNGELLNQSIQYESISECGDTQWRTTSYAESNNSNGTIYMLLPHLEPAVQYIYFVRRFTVYSSMGTSPIQTVTTLPAQPSSPLDFKVNYTTDSDIVLSWKPPSHPHGNITHYVIKGYWQTDKTSDLLQRDYCVYKLQKNELSSHSKSSISTTTIAPKADNNCDCNKEPENCNSFEHVTDFGSIKFDSALTSCDAYIYGIMNANYLNIKSLHEQSSMVEEALDPFKILYTETNHSFESFPSRNVTGADGKYETFRKEVDAGVHTLRLTNLRHYSEYIILISACQEPHKEEDFPWDPWDPCSRETLLTARTERSANADRIDEDKVKIQTNNQTTNISWEEPSVANSFIHSYILEYRSTDVENSKFLDLCITVQQFRSLNETYTIENVAAGHYQLRLKAISLGGEGPYVVKTFYIEEHSQNFMSIIVSSIIVVLVIMCILIGFLYYWRLQLSKNRILFASVNPRYEPVYVEDHWEVPREHLTLVKQLGRGIFGSVHEGILQPDNIRCAVKTVSAVCEEDNMLFLKEATLMKEFHKAHHIVKLIGVVSKGSPVYVIMELMELGDLKSFLLRHGEELCDENKVLPTAMIMKMAAEIADGMAFLEAKKFVHRDLAARNCMVAGDKSIKIGDFGLARDIYETDYYRKGDKGTLPIRWMAPESIRDGIFTTNSDVWSFAVVLWEITTLAQMPYHPRTNEEVIKYVQSGQILDLPANTHEVLRPIMRCCWRWHASHRPKFVQILKILDAFIDQKFRKVSFFHNGENPSDSSNVIPFKMAMDDCYIYNDENDEVNLYLGQSPSASSSSASAVKYQRNIPFRANGHIENLR